MGVHPPPTMKSYGGVPVNQNVTINSDNSFMGVLPPLLRHIGGEPANQKVTIYSEDSFMGVPPSTITSYRGGYLPIKMLLNIAMTHAWA